MGSVTREDVYARRVGQVPGATKDHVTPGVPCMDSAIMALVYVFKDGMAGTALYVSLLIFSFLDIVFIFY